VVVTIRRFRFLLVGGPALWMVVTGLAGL